MAQFSATIDNPGTSQDKTSIAIVEDLGVISWQAGDAIAVYDNAGTMAELTTTGFGTTAVFEGPAELGDGPYTAIYPAAMATGSNTISLGTTQTHSTTHFDAPMYATSANTSLTFKNPCSVLKINVDYPKSIRSIEVHADQSLCGDFQLGMSNGNATMSCTANGDNIVTLDCGTGADCSEGHDFYIYLPANTYTGMTITLKATDGSICVKTLNVNSWTLAPSTYYSLNFNEEKDGIDQEHWLYRLPVRLTQNFNW